MSGWHFRSNLDYSLRSLNLSPITCLFDIPFFFCQNAFSLLICMSKVVRFSMSKEIPRCLGWIAFTWMPLKLSWYFHWNIHLDCCLESYILMLCWSIFVFLVIPLLECIWRVNVFKSKSDVFVEYIVFEDAFKSILIHLIDYNLLSSCLDAFVSIYFAC